MRGQITTTPNGDRVEHKANLTTYAVVYLLDDDNDERLKL